ncbi:MAG: gliding motility-associated C-terminal domain-containing protein [Bacteroidia bacterium]
MKRTLRIVLLFLTVFAFNKSSKATHMMGADMSYRCLGNGKYKITAKVYRDCRGVSMSPVSFGAFAGTNGGNGCGSTTLSGLKRTGIRDVTQRCSSSSNPCNPKNTYGTGKGVEEHTFEVTIDFTKSPLKQFVNKSSCCEITFYVTQCCRNGAITTGAANNNFYSTCMINICNIPKTENKCNSSPQLSNEPVGFLCCNTPWYYNNGAVDTVDFDSISYKLVRGLRGIPNNSVNYSSPFTHEYPMTPFCIPPTKTNIKCRPRTNLNPPRGFYFDESNGDIIVTPTNCKEVPILVIEQTEYRKDSAKGNWIVIGRTRRDMQMWVIDECGYNKPPIINGPFNWNICEGEKICKKIKIEDETFTPHQTVPDTVLATWNGGIPGATFEVVDPKKREKEYEFCWETKIGDASDVSYTFTVRATDQHCTPPMISIRSFKVKVNPKAQTVRNYDTLKCGRLAMTSMIPGGFKGTPSYKWSVRDSSGKNELFYSGKKTDTMNYYYGGKYIFVHTINNSFNCPTIYRDTVEFPAPPRVIMATADTFACFGTDITLKPTVLDGKKDYSYKWDRYTYRYDTVSQKMKISNQFHVDGDTLDQLKMPSIQKDTVIRIQVTDGDGCIFYDTAAIFVKPLPILDLGPDQRICTYETQIFDAQNLDTVQYYWSTGDTTQTITVHVEDDYDVLVVEQTWFCEQRDTVHLYVNDTAIAIPNNDTTICNEQSVELVAAHSPSAESAIYEWVDITGGKTLGSQTNYTVSPRNTGPNGGSEQNFLYSLYTKVTQGGHSCEHTDTMQITVNALPVVKWLKKPLPSECFDYGDIELNSFLNVGKDNGVRIWGGSFEKPNNMVDSVTPSRHIFKTTNLSNSQLQNGKNYQEKIYGWFKDDNGCINYDSTIQRIDGNPILELKDKVYCQDLGEIKMDETVEFPKTKSGKQFEWVVQEWASGTDSARLLVNLNPWGTPDWRFKFGSPTEDYYQGDYKFKLCITDIITGCQSCDTTAIQIIAEPTVTVLTPNPVCVNWDNIDLNDYVTVNGLGGADADGGEFKVTEVDYVTNDPRVGMSLPQGHLFPPSTGAGTYKILYSNDGTGCLKVDSFYVYVNDTPDALLLPPVTLCSSGPKLDLNTRIDMTNTKPQSGTPSWFGPNLTGSMFDPISTGTSEIEGPYELTLAYTDNNGCADTETYIVFVRSQPEVEITTINPYPQCENTPFPVQSESKFSNGKVNWTLLNNSDGSVDNSTAENIVYTHGPGDKANKMASLKVTTEPIANDVCPQASDSILIIIHPYPVLEPLAKFTGCIPLSTDWSVTETGGIPQGQLSYDWDFGNGDTSNDQFPAGIMYPTQGRYDVKVTVTNNTPDGGQCATTENGPQHVEAYPLPDAYFETDPSYSTTVALPKFQMINKTKVEEIPFNPSISYVWDFGTLTGDTAMSENPKFAYSKDTGIYRIFMTATTSHGCVDTFSRLVHIGPDIIVFIPDVFTPNSEGPNRNERFNAVATNFKTFDLKVYNRWGEKLFETNDPDEGWDGNDPANNPCMQGVYVYRLVITSFEDKEYTYDGTITLLR